MEMLGLILMLHKNYFCRNFLFPTDLQLDMEFWAQTGEFEEDELHEVASLFDNGFLLQLSY